MRVPLSVVIAIAIGLIVLLGYFVPIGGLTAVRAVLLEWAVVLAAVALLVGIANFLYVHWRKVSLAQPGSVYSAVLILSLVLTLGVVGWFGPTHAYSMWLFNYIQVPVESSLMALLAVIMVYASARLLRRRLNVFTLVFVVTALLILLSTAPLVGVEVPGLSELRAWVAQVPAVAGARGVLLGVALGGIATGLRVLMGVDRPYEG